MVRTVLPFGLPGLHRITLKVKDGMNSIFTYQKLSIEESGSRYAV